MKNTILLLSFFLLLMPVRLFCQDTAKAEPSIHHTKMDLHKLMGKGYHGAYAKEVITYSATHKRIDYCYYVDGDRKCIGKEYWIVRDSILVIGDSVDLLRHGIEMEILHFRILPSGEYYVFRESDNIFESAISKSIIPLHLVSPIVTTTIERKDTLWITNLNYSIQNQPFGSSKFELYESHINDSVFEYNEIDIHPSFLNGDSLKSISINGISSCFCEPVFDLTLMSCIITKEGDIKNVEVAIGSVSMCNPTTIKDITQRILLWGKLRPAYKNGEPVTVRWFISIDNQGRRGDIHPVFDDTPDRRAQYIHLKRTGEWR